MFPTLAMVKFFTQPCPLCSSGRNTLPNGFKCLCLVKGHMIPSRGYVEGDDKKSDKGAEPSKEPAPNIGNPEKSNEERFFTEVAKKYLDELKRQEDKLKKKPEDTD